MLFCPSSSEQNKCDVFLTHNISPDTLLRVWGFFIFIMKIFESQLEDIIFETHSDVLSEKGLLLHENRVRQLRIGNYGICDMIAYGKQNHPFYKKVLDIQVIELKQHEINMSTFNQVLRYVKGITRYLDKHKPDLIYSITVVLIGSKINKDDSLVYLPELLSDEDFSIKVISRIDLYTYKYTINGMEFTPHHNYKLIQEGF